MLPEREPLITRQRLLLSVGLIALFVLGLIGEGRIPCCKCGFGLVSPAWSESTSQHLLDPYTLSHVLHGVLFYWFLRAVKAPLYWRFVLALLLEIGWELLENSTWVIERYRTTTAAFDYTGDSILNSLGDVLAAAVGFAIAARFVWQVSVAVFVSFELLALYLSRDNLSLNVLMLLYPIESIKTWQLEAITVALALGTSITGKRPKNR